MTDEPSARERRLAHAAVIVDALLDRTYAGDAEALAAFAASMPPAALYAHPGAVVRSANAAWRAMFATEVPAALVHAIGRVAAEGTAIHLAEVAIAGPLMWCAATVRARRDPSGAVVAAIVVCEDCTDEVVARTLGVDPAALVSSGRASGAADYYNRRWLSVIGEATWEAAILDSDAPRCRAALAEATRDGNTSNEVEVRLTDANGIVRWHRVAFTVTGGRWYATAVEGSDAGDEDAERSELIARLRAARGSARQADRLKDQFLARVSHELRAPLTTMQLWERVLRDPSSTEAARESALDAIHQSVAAQTRLVGDLLDVARAASGKLHVDLRPTEIEPLVAAAIAAIAPIAEARHVAIVRGEARTAGHVAADAARLAQVLGNLLSNAVKFSEPRGRVIVDSYRRGRSVIIEVVDEGRGIAPEFLPHLFEPFSQVSDILARHEGGLGLGLSIARQLVELHHGTLVAASAGLGHGAKLTVSLPLADGPLALTYASTDRPQTLGDLSVLVVDDDPRVLEALALLLERAGAVVDTADSAAAARERITAKRPGVLVCDIAMPGEDGYQLIASLRASSCEIPAIALTAHASEADGRRALAAGFDLHLAKPIDIEHLVAAIYKTSRRSIAIT